MNASPTLLEVRNVSKHFGGVKAVDHVSFELAEGEILGLVGDNGAGKSTLISIISGVQTPTSGTIVWQGQELQGRSPREVRDLGIETIYQDLALADNLGVADNLFLGREPTRRALGLFPVLDRRRMRDQSNGALGRLKIEFDPSRVETVRDLSGGQRQAVAIGRAIFWNARLLIMDEPTAALGVKERNNILNLIRLLKQEGVTIILISHNFPDIFAVTNRILVMRRGRLVANLTTADTDEHSLVSQMIGMSGEVDAVGSQGSDQDSTP